MVTLRSLFNTLFYQTTWSPPKVYQMTVSEKIHRTDLFQRRHGPFLVSIKQPGPDIWKKSLSKYHCYLFFFKF